MMVNFQGIVDLCYMYSLFCIFCIYELGDKLTSDDYFPNKICTFYNNKCLTYDTSIHIFSTFLNFSNFIFNLYQDLILKQNKKEEMKNIINRIQKSRKKNYRKNQNNEMGETSIASCFYFMLLLLRSSVSESATCNMF